MKSIFLDRKPILTRGQASRYEPVVTGRIHDRRVSLTIRPVGGRVFPNASSIDRALVGSIDVRHVIVQPHGHGWIRTMRLAHFNGRITNANHSVRNAAILRVAVNSELISPE